MKTEIRTIREEIKKKMGAFQESLEVRIEDNSEKVGILQEEIKASKEEMKEELTDARKTLKCLLPG
jgi:hypothetical protein